MVETVIPTAWTRPVRVLVKVRRREIKMRLKMIIVTAAKSERGAETSAVGETTIVMGNLVIAITLDPVHNRAAEPVVVLAATKALTDAADTVMRTR